MVFRTVRHCMILAACAALVMGAAEARPAGGLGTPPTGFVSATAGGLHFVRGGRGPAVILLHGFPEDWVEYRAIMPRLARRFTVVAVDLPGMGRSAPTAGGYDSASIAGRIHALASALSLERPYVVGHDLGAIVTYAYVRRFPRDVRGAMILDVPMPGMAGSEEAGRGFWHVGFIQVPGLAEQLVPGRQAAFLGWFLDMGRFTPAERAYFFRAYGARQLRAAFETYRALPRDAAFNAAQTGPNPTPLVVAVGARSFTADHLPRFIDGYRTRGMSRVEGARIADANHYVVADNPGAVAELVERHAGDPR
jgi:pimeloyl-ACP methyl ester carboxylesterase